MEIYRRNELPRPYSSDHIADFSGKPRFFGEAKWAQPQRRGIKINRREKRHTKEF